MSDEKNDETHLGPTDQEWNVRFISSDHGPYINCEDYVQWLRQVQSNYAFMKQKLGTGDMDQSMSLLDILIENVGVVSDLHNKNSTRH